FRSPTLAAGLLLMLFVRRPKHGRAAWAAGRRPRRTRPPRPPAASGIRIRHPPRPKNVENAGVADADPRTSRPVTDDAPGFSCIFDIDGRRKTRDGRPHGG